MLSSLEVAEFLSKEFNNAGATFEPVCDFKIMAEVGRNDSGYDINGILRTVSANPESAVQGNKNINYVYSVELLCGGVGNYNIERAQRAVGMISEKLNGSKTQFLSGTGLITMSESRTKAHNVGIGEDTVIDFEIQIDYSENVITSGDKHWFLDDVEIQFTSESILLEKDGLTKKINEDQYSKTLLTGQTKYYNFEIPFSTQDRLCTMLQRDLLLGDFHKQYTLKYYDGASFTEEAPFSTTVSIFRNANSKSVKPKSSVFNITFADVDDGRGKTKYYFGLCDTPFDNSSNNTRYFEDGGGTTAKEKQIVYWNEKVRNGCIYEEIESPNIESLDITQQVYVNNNNYELFDLINKNYAVIKVSGPDSTKYYYYFVTNATAGSGNQVMFDLKLDTVQTYFFDPNIQFSDCLINRAHLNRWIDNGDGTVSFDGMENSKMFLEEPGGDMPKRLLNMLELKWKYTSSEEINEWLNKNVAFWVYAFIDKTHNYSGQSCNGTANNNISGGLFECCTEGAFNEEVDNPYTVLCYPVYKHSLSNKIQVRYGDIYREIDGHSMFWFKSKNGESSYIYNCKISLIPPFNSINFKSIINGKLIININHSSANTINPQIADESRIFLVNNNYALFGGFVQSSKPLESYPLKLDDYPFKFNKSLLLNSASEKYNPKMYSQNNMVVRLRSFDGSYFDYDYQKINSNILTFLYNETLTPEITRYYCRLKTPQGLYVEDTNKSLLGLVGSSDMGIAISNDQYALYLANNKNSWLQSLSQTVGNGIVDVGRSMVAGSKLGLMGGVASGLSNAASIMFNRALTIDNMKEAPDSLRNANGCILYSTQIKNLTMYIEIHGILNSVRSRLNSENKLFGYCFDDVSNVKDYAAIRHYYNYIEAEINSIDGIAISNNARMDLKQRFQQGIRFWNSDNIQYDLENYERWLE